MARKKEPANKPVDSTVIDIVDSDPILKFRILGDNGKVDEIEGTLSSFHQTVVLSQGEFQEKEPSSSPEGYVTYLAKKLSSRFKIRISDTVAYKIANVVFDRFMSEKKS